MEKVCRKCGKLLPLSEFYPHKMMLDGHLNFCKECVKERVRNHRIKNAEKLREYDRVRSILPKRKKLKREVTERRFREVAGMRSSQLKLRRAVAAGKIHRSEYCQVCGTICKTEAHHNDYSRPYDVVWLCSACHSQYHCGKTGIAADIRTSVNEIFAKAYG